MRNLYRYQESLYTGSKLLLTLSEYPIIKGTKCGCWIDIYGQKRFVLNNARKRYACDTKEEAYISYLARKKRQLRILKAQVLRVEAAIRLSPDQIWSFFDDL